MENEIIVTVKDLSVILATLVPVALFVIQQIKESVKLENKSAEILSLGVGCLLSVCVAAVYANDSGFALTLSQWIGLGIFVVLGTLGPSGGYKFLAEIAGSRED